MHHYLIIQEKFGKCRITVYKVQFCAILLPHMASGLLVLFHVVLLIISIVTVFVIILCLVFCFFFLNIFFCSTMSETSCLFFLCG